MNFEAFGMEVHFKGLVVYDKNEIYRKYLPIIW